MRPEQQVFKKQSLGRRRHEERVDQPAQAFAIVHGRCRGAGAVTGDHRAGTGRHDEDEMLIVAAQ
jgi:hypothetical protein